MLYHFTFYIGDHHLVLYGWECIAVNIKCILMQGIVLIDIMNICSITDKTGIGIFPDSTNGNFWGHTRSMNQICFIQPLIPIKFAASSALLKVVFLFRLNRRSHGPLGIRHKVFVFQITNDI